MIYKTIEELTTVVTGGTPSTSKAEYWENGNIPWLQSGCCQNCDVNQADKFISQSGYDNSSTQVMPVNTVMIALTGATAGKVGYLNIEACGNQSITGVFPCEELNPRFLFYFLISQRRKILVDCVGGAQAHISQGYVKKIKVPVYSKNLQERIVNIMNICSKNIKHYEMILKEYDELVKARFVEMFGDPIINPYGFPVKKIDEVAVLNKGITYSPDDISKEGIIVLRSGNIKGNAFDLEDIVRISKKISNDKLVNENDILMCNRNGSVNLVGKVAKIPKLEEKMTFGTFMTIVRSEIFEYLFVFFQMNAFREQIKFQTAVAINQISLPLLASVKVPIPTNELIKEFADFVEQVDKSREEVKKSLEKTQQLYDSLMQEYFG